MTYRGTDDLRGYLKDAILPRLEYAPKATPLCISGHKTHRNHLTVRNQRYRQLYNISPIKPLYDMLVVEWIKKKIPNRSLGVLDEDEETGRTLSVPSSHKFEIAHISLPPVRDLERIYSFVLQFPLQTAERIIHLVFPKAKCWHFETNFDDNDTAIYREIHWSDYLDSEHPANKYVAIIIACQPSWILSYEDLWQFTELCSLPTDEFHFRGKERLWGKLWDSCVRKRAHFFVLTSYQHWVFGTFSEGYTSALVSPVISAGSRDPTIMEALVYWIATALGAPDSFMWPNIPEPINNLHPEFKIPESPKDLSALAFAESLSSWDGKSEEPVSSAGCATAVPDEDMKTPTIFLKPRDSSKTREMVRTWLAGVLSSNIMRPQHLTISEEWKGDTNAEPLMSDFFDELSSLCSSSSEDTETGAPQGHWLALPCSDVKESVVLAIPKSTTMP
ncbi:hypothetical protein BJ138DRAFT_1076501 [Hygrophoropsis aurantiaca]|uniref:Uncharacterized protein n=1 Tax=Hygrophoropsis aurantiaca TaxID=72124 RepID=A0ACB8AQJ1_9AGAM|nr:hypothetical protein BJ138DRAFT_1076501 [Hygrophoropsis aurantiaca]